jgi:organic hydroperoxide reductase OsmC/OhrA
MARNAARRLAMTEVKLRPRVTFSGKQPTKDEHAAMHERAHDACFIAASVNTVVSVDPAIEG